MENKLNEKKGKENANNNKYHHERSKFDAYALFHDEASALDYETSLSKNHLTKAAALTSSQHELASLVFQLIAALKTKSPSQYSHMISYLRFPFHTIKQDMGLLNMDVAMGWDSFKECFSRIVALHSRCHKIGEAGICIHIQEFCKQIMDM